MRVLDPNPTPGAPSQAVRHRFIPAECPGDPWNHPRPILCPDFLRFLTQTPSQGRDVDKQHLLGSANQDTSLAPGKWEFKEVPGRMTGAKGHSVPGDAVLTTLMGTRTAERRICSSWGSPPHLLLPWLLLPELVLHQITRTPSPAHLCCHVDSIYRL